MSYRYLIKSIATLGPLGYTLASGTVGSCAALLGVYFLQKHIADLYLQAYILLIFVLVTLYILRSGVEQFKAQDPREIILDEVIGCFVAFYGMPWNITCICLCFAFFRFFDITKFFGIANLEKTFTGAGGIVVDDLAAGLLANITVRCLLYV